jgi:hypothetical protein
LLRLRPRPLLRELLRRPAVPPPVRREVLRRLLLRLPAVFRRVLVPRELLRPPPRDDAFFFEVFFRDFFVRPSLLRFLFTVAAAIAFARLLDRPVFPSLSLMCSYIRSSLLLQAFGIPTPFKSPVPPSQKAPNHKCTHAAPELSSK